MAITNWILFPFYKSQFCFYVFVSIQCECMSFVRLLSFFGLNVIFSRLPTIGSASNRRLSREARIHMTLGRNISLWYLLMFFSHLIEATTQTHIFMHTAKEKERKTNAMYIKTIKLRLYFIFFRHSFCANPNGNTDVIKVNERARVGKSHFISNKMYVSCYSLMLKLSAVNYRHG